MASTTKRDTARTRPKPRPPVNRVVVVEKGKSAGKTVVRNAHIIQPRAARQAPPLIRTGDTLTTLTPRDEEALAIGRDFLDQREMIGRDGRVTEFDAGVPRCSTGFSVSSGACTSA